MINKKLKGFTLVETLVAITILATAIAGPLTIASQGLTTSLIAKDQITAYYLAQDAVEFVRFVRDSNTLGGNDWLLGTGGSGGVSLSNCEATNGCNIDSNTATISACNPNCTAMKFNTSNNFYNTSGTVLPAFTRKIKLTPPGGSGTITNEAVMTVTVSWSDQAGITRSVNVIENIFNWQ